MKLYIKQRVFSWKDKFSVFDENENLQYFAESEVFTFGKKLHLFDACGMEVSFISETVTFFMPRFSIIRNGEEVAEVVREFTFFRPKYRIDGLGWRVEGEVFDHVLAMLHTFGLQAFQSPTGLDIKDSAI